MLELYRSELRRFGKGVAIYGLAHLLVLAMLHQVVDVISGPSEFQIILLVWSMLSGLGLALYQFGTYRKPGRWIWLLHRPVHRAHILAALAMTALTWAVLAVALPMFTVLAFQEHVMRHVVDARHYAGAAYLALAALSAWMAGGYVMLQRSRWAFVVLVLPPILTMHQASAATVLGLGVACNALMLLLLYSVFRPSRHVGDDAAAVAGSALPLQLCIYCVLLWVGSTVFQAGQLAAGVHPQLNDNVRPDSLAAARDAMPADAIRAALATSNDPRAAAWRAMLVRQYLPWTGLDERMYLVRQHTVRGALVSNGGNFSQADNSRWTFSHDRMKYHGEGRPGRASLGWLDAGGVPFPAPPAAAEFREHVYFVGAQDLHAMAKTGRDPRHLLRLDGAEQFYSGAVELGSHRLALTTRRLVMFDETGKQLAQIRLPLPAADLESVSAARVPDGVLVSLIHGHRQRDGVPAAPQIVYLIDPAGGVQEVARRELQHDFPALYEHKDWWLSPVLYTLAGLPAVLIDNGTPADADTSRYAPLSRARPAGAWIAAAALALLSAAGACWWLRATRAMTRERLAWLAACLVLGLPALLSLMMLRPREHATVRAGRPAMAAAV